MIDFEPDSIRKWKCLLDKFVHVEILFQAILESERERVCWKRLSLWSQVIFEGEIGDKWNLNGMFNTPYFDQEMKTNFTVQVLFSTFLEENYLSSMECPTVPILTNIWRLISHLGSISSWIILNKLKQIFNKYWSLYFITNRYFHFYQLIRLPPFVVNRIIFPQSCFFGTFHGNDLLRM